MFDEEESKKLRIFQRHERQELQLVIARCNEVAFDYVCLPSVRSDKDLCFGSKTPRKIHLFADDKAVSSFMRKCFRENFPEPVQPIEAKKAEGDEWKDEIVEVKPTHPFASRVPRFLEITIDSTGVYRRKRKTRQPPEVVKKIYSAFGSSNKRDFLITRKPVTSKTPGVGVYNIDKPKKTFFHHAFGGSINLEPAFEIICGPTNFDTKCEDCEEKPVNVYWKNKKTQIVLCRSCYNQTVFEIKKKTRGILDKYRKLNEIKDNFEKKRHCDFYHQHNNTTAAVRLLTRKQFHQRINHENFLNTLLKY